jgi:hypothetical protein
MHLSAHAWLIMHQYTPRSMKHKRPMKILDHLTPGKFWGKGTKLSFLVKEFIKEGVSPQQDKHPQFDWEILIDELVPKDTRTPMDKLSERANDNITLFIFIQYHNGYTTNGRIGLDWIQSQSCQPWNRQS